MDPLREFGRSDGRLLVDIGQEFLNGRVDLPQNIENWKLIMSNEEIELCVRSVARRLNEMLKDETKPIVLSGILKGVYIFMASLSRHLTFPFSVYFIEASSYRDKMVADEVELLSVIVPSKFQGRKVVLIDELFDNGATMALVYAKLLQLPLDLQKGDIIRCTLFAKRKKAHFPEPDLSGIVLPDVWLVGYGLDNEGNLRGWPDLWGLPKIEGIPASPDDEVFSADKEVADKTTSLARTYLIAQLKEM